MFIKVLQYFIRYDYLQFHIILRFVFTLNTTSCARSLIFRSREHFYGYKRSQQTMSYLHHRIVHRIFQTASPI